MYLRIQCFTVRIILYFITVDLHLTHNTLPLNRASDHWVVRLQNHLWVFWACETSLSFHLCNLRSYLTSYVKQPVFLLNLCSINTLLIT